MKTYELERKWSSLFVMPGMFFLLWAITIIFFLLNPRKPDFQLNSPVIIFFAVLGIITIGFSLYMPLCYISTVFTSEGITRNYLVWKKFTGWDSIIEAKLLNVGYYPIVEIILSGY